MMSPSEGVDHPVDHAVHQAVVHRDHDAAARHDLYVVAACHPRDLARPGAGAVEHEVAADPYLLAGLGVMADHRGDRVAVPLDARHLVVGEDLGAVLLRGLCRGPDELPAVDRAVLYGDGALDARVQAWLAGQCFGDPDLGRGHAIRGCSLKELVAEIDVVVGAGDEQPAGRLDGSRLDPGDDDVLLGAFAGRVRVADHVAATRVQQAVEPSGRALREVDPVDEHRLVAAHRDIADDPDTGRPATDHHHVDIERTHRSLPAWRLYPAPQHHPRRGTPPQRGSPRPSVTFPRPQGPLHIRSPPRNACAPPPLVPRFVA